MAFANINGTVLHHEFLTEDEDAPVVVFINSLGHRFPHLAAADRRTDSQLVDPAL